MNRLTIVVTLRRLMTRATTASAPAQDVSLPGMVLRAQAGDRVALNALIEQMYPLIRRHLMLMRCDPDLRDEITQVVAEKMVRRLASVRQPDSIVPWMIGITRNGYRAEMNRRSRERSAHISLDDDPATEHLLTDRWHGTELTESSISIQQALHSIAPIYREVLVLSSSNDLTVAELAGVLDISTAATYQRLARALHEFRERLSLLDPNGPT